jgi:hypothetical protein
LFVCGSVGREARGRTALLAATSFNVSIRS